MYGSEPIETVFSDLESKISIVFRQVVERAWSSGLSSLTLPEIYWLLKGILFQRSRTVLEVNKHRPATESLVLEMLKEYIRHDSTLPQREELIAHITNGSVRVRQSFAHAALHHVRAALESTALLSDLHPCVLLNYTDYPFVFSDSPVVFYNSYYRNIMNRGVLGLQTPGLQVFMPLDSRTLLMLMDPVVYSGPFQGHMSYVLYERSDISQLNALQLHHSSDAIYLSNIDSAGYVTDLWRAHREKLTTPQTSFHILSDAIIDGKPADGIVYHSFEPQLPHNLALSFVSCDPIEPSDFVYRYRTPEIMEEHERRYPRRKSNG